MAALWSPGTQFSPLWSLGCPVSPRYFWDRAVLESCMYRDTAAKGCEMYRTFTPSPGAEVCVVRKGITRGGGGVLTGKEFWVCFLAKTHVREEAVLTYFISHGLGVIPVWLGVATLVTGSYGGWFPLPLLALLLTCVFIGEREGEGEGRGGGGEGDGEGGSVCVCVGCNFA